MGRLLLIIFILEHILVVLIVCLWSRDTKVPYYDLLEAKVDVGPPPIDEGEAVTLGDPMIVYYKDRTPDPQLSRDNYYVRRPAKVNEFNYSFVNKPVNACNNGTFLAVLVHSKTSYYDKRDVIRRTWGNALKTGQWPSLGNESLANVKVVFILGLDNSTEWNTFIERESLVYNDIVQGSFVDSYINMTLKSLLGLRWVWQECHQPPYMLKMDDDVVVNFPRLIGLLKAVVHKTKVIMGPINQKSRVERKGIWGVPETVFPFHVWPAYVSGSAYVISQDIVKDLYVMSEYIPHIHVDDAYITGVLVTAIHVRHTLVKGFAYWGSKKPHPCDFIRNKIYTGTKMNTVQDLVTFWTQLSDPSLHCYTATGKKKRN